MLKKLLPVIALGILGSAASAQTYLGTANSFNAFIFGNASLTGNDADGALAIGGNLTVSSYTTSGHGLYGTVPSPTTDTNISIYANNLVSASNLQVDGNAYFGSGSSSGVLSNGGTINIGSQYITQSVFTNQQTYSQSQSQLLAANAPTLTAGATSSGINTTTDPNNWTINAATLQGTSTTKYATILASKLSSANGANINVTNLGGATLVINVVDDGNWSSTNFSINGVGYDQVLWNYYTPNTSDGVTISGRELDGSLLTPYATVTQDQTYAGNLIANNWIQNTGEIHFGVGKEFDGVVPQPNSPNVPEPGTYALFGSLAVTGAGIVARGKRRRRPRRNAGE
jgi:choice-of-anchor A domain-containing protein